MSSDEEEGFTREHEPLSLPLHLGTFKYNFVMFQM